MAYKLEVTPSRGVLTWEPNSLDGELDPTFNHVPSLIEAPARHLISAGQTLTRLLFQTSTSSGSQNGEIVRFNNTDLTQVTQVYVSSDFFNSDSNFPGNSKYFVVVNHNNFEDFVSFKVNSFSEDTNTTPDYIVLNVTYDYGRTTAWTGILPVSCFEDSIFPSFSGGLAPRRFVTYPGGVITFEGNRDEINTILQKVNAFTWWGELSTAITMFQTSTIPNFDAYGRGFYNSINTTSDALVTFQITKDGIAQDPYVTTLKYIPAQSKANPGGLTL